MDKKNEKIEIPTLISAPQAAKILNLAPSTLYRWKKIGDNRLPYIEIGAGKRLRYKKSDVLQYKCMLDDLYNNVLYPEGHPKNKKNKSFFKRLLQSVINTYHRIRKILNCIKRIR